MEMKNKVLRALKAYRGLTAEQIAANIPASRTWVVSIECGRVRNVDWLGRYVDALGGVGVINQLIEALQRLRDMILAVRDGDHLLYC